MADESKSEKVSMNITPTEMRALEFIRRIHGDRYDGSSSVLRDYSLDQAVQAYTTARAVASQPA